MIKALALIAGLVFAGNAVAQPARPEVTNAWARATPGGTTIGAAYLTVLSATPDRLVAAASPVARKAELHMMSMSGGVMTMRPLDGIDLPAGRPVTFKPGGLHIMLMGLKAPLREGRSFPLTLTFAKAGKREVEVTVAKVGAMGPPAAKH